MSKSKEQKRLDKQVKEGHFDVRKSRLNWRGLNPMTRRTPTRKECEKRKYLKYHKR